MDEEAEETAAEAVAMELQKTKMQIIVLTAYLDRTDPFWRNRVAGGLDL